MKVIKKIIFFSLILLICVSLTYFVCYIIPSPKISKSNQIEIYDKNENLVMQTHYEVEGSYLTLEEINPMFIYAFIASEDENFFNHIGFSFKGISRALINNLSGGSTQGGSTITQQLARSMFLDNEKSIVRKLKEAFLTIRIETHYDKKQIIEQYLNSIYLGHNIYGIESASLYYFSKSNMDLSIDEIAMIVGIANAPNINAPDINYDNAINRKNYVLNQMYILKYISNEELNHFINKKTNIKINKTKFINHNTPYYFYIVNKLKELNLYGKKTLAKGLKVYTTLDDTIQKKLIEIVNKNNPDDNSQIAAVILKPNSSDVLAMCGGYSIEEEYNRAIKSSRAIGSTIKPLLYYLALRYGMSPDTFMSCNKMEFNIKGYEKYSPSNATNTYSNNPINMIEAIALSDNIYATKTLLYVGFDRFEKILKSFGINSDCVPSSALGVDETNLMNLTSIYNTFASLGTYYRPRIISKITDSNDVILYKNSQVASRKLEKPYVYILNQMLTSTFDEKLIDYSKPTLLNYQTNKIYAAKTGSDKYNSYTIGFNPTYTIGVWSGTDENELFTKSNISKKVFQQLANILESKNIWYNPPSYVVKRKINPITAKDSYNGSIYWFLKNY